MIKAVITFLAGAGLCLLGGCATSSGPDADERVELMKWQSGQGYAMVGKTRSAAQVAQVREWLRANPPIPDALTGAVIPCYELRWYSRVGNSSLRIDQISLYHMISRSGPIHHTEAQLKALESIFAPPP